MERDRPRIVVDAGELEERFNEFVDRAGEGVEVVVMEHGKQVARFIPGDPGPRRRGPSRSVRITPRQRTGPRYMPPPLDIDIPAEVIDRITRESR